MQHDDLSGQVAVVTGGSRGIGFAIARGLAAAGAMTVVASSVAAHCEAAAASLQAEGLRAEAVPVDVRQRAAVEAMVSRVLGTFARIDVLVNAAGVIVRAPIMEATDEQWEAMMTTNLKGAFYCCQIVGRHMLERQRGRIINVSSNITGALQPLRAIYGTSKAALNHLTKAMALEWAPYHVLVNAIAPASTVTDINRHYFDTHPADLEERRRGIPLGRLGVPEDYVGAVLFLASEAAAFVTGQILFVDGGSNLI